MSTPNSNHYRYETEVLGKRCSILFKVGEDNLGKPIYKPFSGYVQTFKAKLKMNLELVYGHHVVFDDGEKAWFDLQAEENAGRLTWKDSVAVVLPSARSKRVQAAPAVRPPPAAPAHFRPIAAVTPLPQDGHIPKKKAKLCRYDKVWMNDMAHWLQTVPHGPYKKICKENSTVNNIMGRVNKLVLGEGLTCAAWPEEIVFYKSVMVDLSSDFKEMWDQAVIYEALHGQDKSNGNSLRVPINKLKEYREYVKGVSSTV